MVLTETLYTHLPPKFAKEVRRYAKRHRLTVSEAMRRALRQLLIESETEKRVKAMLASPPTKRTTRRGRAG